MTAERRFIPDLWSTDRKCFVWPDDGL